MKTTWANGRRTLFTLAGLLLCTFLRAADAPRPVYVVPNFHPASCGWLTDWSTERNYCANSYLDHLDRVRDDPTYNFALSECNNLIALLNFAPQRTAELKQRIREGRVELCNAFFLEPTINLSGGEALVKMGVEGLRWQQGVMGVRPRLSWMIDVTGVHEQMAQIVAGLNLEALVYCRLNPTGSTLHWLQSPDGTRTLAVSPGHYLEWRPMFGAKQPLNEQQLQALANDLRARLEAETPEQAKRRPDAADLKAPPRLTPPGAPILILGGSGDYNLAPLYRGYPAEFLPQFRAVAPQYDVRFTTPSKYLDAVQKMLPALGERLPTLAGRGTEFTYNAFWIQSPRVKSWYRGCEQQLQAAEMLATAANVLKQADYPAQDLYHAWLLMLLNMDRNTLWGAAGGMVFEHPRSWDVRDRFEKVESLSQAALNQAAQALLGKGTAPAVFNSLSWRRTSPAMLDRAVGAVSQRVRPGGQEMLCRLDLPAMGLVAAEAKPPAEPQPIPLPQEIETQHYRLRIDPKTGALASLIVKATGREMLAGPANVVVAERPKKKMGGGDHMVDRLQRERVADSNQADCQVTATRGPLATVIEAESSFLGQGRLRRTTIIYHDDPRIEFETELNDLPNGTVVLAEFPLAETVEQVRRGIPYGFAQATWAQNGTQGIAPAVRWSHYQSAAGGVALFDQGLSGREIVGNTPVIYLFNAVDKYRGYPNAWLSGAGRHVVRYALAAHGGEFATARVPQMAWEFNSRPLAVGACAVGQAKSLLETSDNVIVEALRREGSEIEVRLVECRGAAGDARVTLHLPHASATLTNLVGQERRPLAGGPSYTFPVRPQQIVTLRFAAAPAVPEIQPLIDWAPLVPENKREALRRYLPDVKGHPPAGGG